MTRCCIFVASVLVACAALAIPAHAGEETVPDVVGLQIAEAKALLAEAGFQVSAQSVPGKPIGLVLSQEPGGLATRDTSIPVTLQVGGPTPKPGPGATPPADTPPADTPPADTPPADTPPADTPPADTPPADRPQADAPPAGGGTSPMDTPPAGRADDPPAGSKRGFTWNGRPIPAGRMANTNGPAVPGVLGQTSAQAQRALRSYRVKVEQTNAMRELVGQVLNQWPYAGSKLAPGEEVVIVVGVARAPSSDHRGVPQVQDRPWREACRAIERAGFATELTAIPSPDAKHGLIVSQSPLPGSLLGRGQVMRLQIGSGTGTYTPGEAGTAREPAPRDPAPRDPAPRDPAPGATAPKDPTPGDAPPAGAGGSPLDTPPAGVGGTDRPPVEQPPTQKPPVQRPPVEPPPIQEPRDPQPARSLSAPALREPPAGESYPYRYGANFSWTAISGAKTYELELQEELPSGAWKTLVTHTVTGTKFRPARLERGRYRWRVRAVGAGAKGKWSEFRRLYMY